MRSTRHPRWSRRRSVSSQIWDRVGSPRVESGLPTVITATRSRCGALRAVTWVFVYQASQDIVVNIHAPCEEILAAVTAAYFGALVEMLRFELGAVDFTQARGTQNRS